MLERIQVVAGVATIVSLFFLSWKAFVALALVTASFLVDWDAHCPSTRFKMFEIELKELMDKLQNNREILNGTNAGSLLVRETENAIRILKHSLSVCRVHRLRLLTAKWNDYIIQSIQLYRHINAHMAYLRRIRIDLEAFSALKNTAFHDPYPLQTTAEEVSRQLHRDVFIMMNQTNGATAANGTAFRI